VPAHILSVAAAPQALHKFDHILDWPNSIDRTALRDVQWQSYLLNRFKTIGA
jgi:hypothetical protein